MFDTLEQREKFVEQLKKEIKRHFPQNNYQIWIFGSFLTNDFVTDKSDIDMGVYSSDVAVTIDIIEYLKEYLDENGIEHDIIPIRLEDTCYMNIPIFMYGETLTSYILPQFIDNLKRLIEIWGTNPFETLLERSRQ